ncbi:hypothetical protein J2P12_05875, partial [Candidatus Bathyarchaeota archaeon]|nr:hypothetical protein [Candidatus Bathyarchaeota archaeon]
MATSRRTQPFNESHALGDQGSESLGEPFDGHRLIVVCVRGNVSVRETIRTIIQNALGPRDIPPLLILGPTAPEDIVHGGGNRIGWVTFVDGTSLAHPLPQVEIISPDNLLEVNLFIEKAAQGENQAIVGDFLDNVIRTIGSPESFYTFFCQLASRVKLKKRTAILVIKEDIHDRSMVETVKRFADVVLEFRDQDDASGLKVEMRTLNFADNIYTAWRPFSD